MFADLVATASRHSDEDTGSEKNGGVPDSDRGSSGSGGSSSRQRRQRPGHDGVEWGGEEDEEDYPLHSGNTPLVGQAYSSPLTDLREQRPGSSEFRSPVSLAGGTASTTSAMASPASQPRAVAAASPAAAAVTAPRQELAARRPPAPAFSSAPSLASTPQASPHHPLSRVALLAAAAGDDAQETSLHRLASAPQRGEEAEDAEVTPRSGTREQHGRLDSPVAAARAVASSSASSTPRAPSLDTPPGSAMKAPRGAGAVTAAAVVTERDAVPRPGATSPLRFRVLYTEEEHRVQLETHETEERRCLFAAHRAIQSVYRMWAAGAAATDYGDAQGEAWPLLELPARPPALLTDRTHTASSALSSSHHESTPPVFASSAVSADRVRSYLNSSVHSARSRRGGESEPEPALAIAAAALHAAVPTPRPHDHRSTHAPLSDGRPSVVLHHSRTSRTSSPAASRMLEYSNLQQYQQPPPQPRGADAHPPLPPSRRFSPWRSDPPSAWHVPSSWAAPQRAPLVPHLVRTSPEAVHRASASSTASAGAWGHERIEPWRSPETRTVGRLRSAPPARDVSPSPRVLLNHSYDGFTLQSDTALVNHHQRHHDDAHSRATPSWNASGNLESTSAASRHLGPIPAAAAADTDREAGVLGYSPNEAFRHRQRAVVQGAAGSSLPRSPREEDDAARRRERLTGYVPYKRFYDAVYGAGGDQHGTTAPPRHQPQPISWAPRTARGTVAAVWQAPTPEPRARAALAPPRPAALATPRGLSAAPPVTALADAALFKARLTRLSTLEVLCRAELQRRWIEDQNVLLHSFIMEGTAVLQRGRGEQGQLARRPSTESRAELVPAWRFGRRTDAA